MARLRRTVIAVHRDLGYLFVGLTLVYAVSGVAVNHVADWNPSYAAESRQVSVVAPPTAGRQELAEAALAALGETNTLKSVVPVGTRLVKVFLEDGGVVTVDRRESVAVLEHLQPRPILEPINRLHLNKDKGLWTWIADLYAVALLTLALTGIFIVPGRKGLGGRGRWLLLAGAVLPVLYLLVAGAKL